MAGDSREDGAQPEEGATGEPMRWRIRLAKGQPQKLTALILLVVAVFLFGTVVYKRPLLGMLGSVMILAATAEFWLGVAYRVDGQGASSRTGLSYTHIRWSEVKRVVVTPVGVKLSPLAESTRLAPFRGVFLRFGSEDGVRIVEAVRRLCGNDVRFLEGSAD